MSDSGITSPTVLALEPGDGVPNNAALPVLLYAQVLDSEASDLAAAFERRFDAHGWPPAWRNGIFAHHHFHSTAHEALGIYSGTVTVRLGGDGGRDLTLRPGDAVVLPAGVAHMRVACEGRLGVVGAYPAGQHPDQCLPDTSRLQRCLARVAAVPVPGADPLFGPRGPLLRHWTSRSGESRPDTV